MDDLIERLLNAEPGARQEAAAEIRRLTAENAKMLAAIYEAAGWSVTSIDEYKSEFGDDADPLDDAITEILYDRKRWAEACEAIRAGKDWPQTHYPSMVDRWTVAAQKQHIDTLTASLAAMERERDDLTQKLTTVLRVEGELRKTVAFARKALVTARDAMSREAWQDGPSISKAERDLGEMIDVIKHEITIEGAEYQLKWAAKRAMDAIRERDAWRAEAKAQRARWLDPTPDNVRAAIDAQDTTDALVGNQSEHRKDSR